MHKLKITLLVSLSLIIFIPAHMAAAKEFTDLPADHWAYNDITLLHESGVIGGYSDGTVKPNNPVTREELAKIAFTLFPRGMDKPFLNQTSRPDYPDIRDRWSSKELDAAARIIPGYTDGYYKPSQPASRRDVAILLLYTKLLQENNYQINNNELNIILPAPESGAWEKMKQFKEYANLETLYKQSNKYLEKDPQKSGFSKYAGQHFSHLNNIALLLGENIVRGYEDKTLQLEGDVTRAETCTIANRISEIDFSKYQQFIIESPAVKAIPHPVQCNNNTDAHNKIAALGQWYNQQYPAAEERARAIYNFLVFNFSYNWDYQAGISKSAPVELEATISTGTGTETNFVNLYAVLAKYAGINAAVIKGTSENPSGSGPHTWVELDISDQPLPVDPTYGICNGKIYFDNFRNWSGKGYEWIENSRQAM